eukprot:COSAG02_NODE_22584_length_747_cov_1.325617_1_plen_76_part_10
MYRYIICIHNTTQHHTTHTVAITEKTEQSRQHRRHARPCYPVASRQREGGREGAARTVIPMVDVAEPSAIFTVRCR